MSETARSQLLTLVHFCEHRDNRSYDEQDASHLRHPNGSLIASYDRGFLAAAALEVIRITQPIVAKSRGAAA